MSVQAKTIAEIHGAGPDGKVRIIKPGTILVLSDDEFKSLAALRAVVRDTTVNTAPVFEAPTPAADAPAPRGRRAKAAQNSEPQPAPVAGDDAAAGEGDTTSLV